MSHDGAGGSELDVLRHSTAHVMAKAVQRLYPGAKLAIGPTIENGFYYDIDIPRTVSSEDLTAIEDEMRRIIAADEPAVVEAAQADRDRDDPGHAGRIRRAAHQDLVCVRRPARFAGRRGLVRAGPREIKIKRSTDTPKEKQVRMKQISIQMNKQISRVMRKGGRYVSITYGQPDTRIDHYRRKKLHFEVEHKTVDKPVFSSDSSPTSNYHVYVMTKIDGGKEDEEAEDDDEEDDDFYDKFQANAAAT